MLLAVCGEAGWGMSAHYPAHIPVIMRGKALLAFVSAF